MKLEAKFSTKLLLSIGLMFIGLFVLSVIVMLLAQAIGSTGKWFYFTSAFLQNIIAFILPAVACAFLVSEQPWHALRADKPAQWPLVLAVIAVYFISIPMLNCITEWNSHMTLPRSLQAIEEAMRNSEMQAQGITGTMLQGNSFMGMIAMVLVVGVLTGVGEEFFFRGSLLGLCLDRPVNKHVAIMAVAIVFSAFHFQFFGFVPRVLLGLWFGYLMLWTRSLWGCIVAHAFNNGMVVVVTWLSEQGVVDIEAFSTWGVPRDGEWPILALLSTIATIIAIGVTRKLATRSQE